MIPAALNACIAACHLRSQMFAHPLFLSSGKPTVQRLIAKHTPTESKQHLYAREPHREQALEATNSKHAPMSTLCHQSPLTALV